MKLTRYGIPQIAVSALVLGALAALCLYAGRAWAGWAAYLAILPAVVFLWVLSFFRDPHRDIPDAPRLLVGPADGTVTHIDEVDEPTFIGGRAIRISLFLSIFNVHLNRAPCAGRVAHLAYRKGTYVNAMRDDSSHLNEANDLGLETDEPRAPRVLVRQIAGLIARTIVCDTAVGDRLERGQVFGMIKFGSRTELYLPADSGLDVRVKVGDPVRAGATVLGELPCD